MKIGYARVSTKDQTLETQLSRLAEAGCELFFEEKISGAAKKRPQLETMLGQFRKGDVVVVTKLDRLARSTVELLRIAEALNEKTAGLQSLDEPWADTTSPAGKMIMTVFGGIAEFERSLILTRTQEGREAAQARGVAFGRPSKLRQDQKEVVRDLVKNGQSISAVARTFNVHPATIYRCLEEKQAL
ncbi:MAG: recombinase family protein [Verrucomicrobia bacterium]|nr:recombinase family protein [Verrucomicrobiota bacterium]